ncbi:MAG: flagellar biosynthetic protein FliR [Deltaproteobacteria bacterium GWA2_54_12]|nr:MAG: flagellar biosynthetic protein FliR [Deltaproteobacteria bacterium GWA2_54_12]
MDITNYMLANYSTFIFVLARTGSILMTAPIFSAFNIPMQVKLGLILLLALLLTPLAPVVAAPQTFTGIIMGLAGELMIGAAVGLAIKFVFTGIEYAGQVASFQMGIGMASAYDPINSAQVTVLGKLMSILTLLIFLTVNGHLMVIMALEKSFEVIPPYGFTLSGTLMDSLIIFSREIFILGLKFSAPVVAILIFVNLAMGIMARTVPQLNMFAIGFAVTISVGFVMILISMPVFEDAAISVFDRMWQGVDNLLRVM